MLQICPDDSILKCGEHEHRPRDVLPCSFSSIILNKLVRLGSIAWRNFFTRLLYVSTPLTRASTHTIAYSMYTKVVETVYIAWEDMNTTVHQPFYPSFIPSNPNTPLLLAVSSPPLTPQAGPSSTAGSRCPLEHLRPRPLLTDENFE
jgi:hypothetical protein